MTSRHNNNVVNVSKHNNRDTNHDAAMKLNVIAMRVTTGSRTLTVT